jgi:hypothetical protein
MCVRHVVEIAVLVALGASCGWATNVGTDARDSGTTQGRHADPCGNGIDDDANGSIDDGCPCGPGEVQSCFPGALAIRNVGACTDGLQTCRAQGAEWGDWGNSPCEGAVVAATEQCDGMDRDCDGAKDDGCPCTPGETRACGVDFVHAPCMAGTQTCSASLWSGCVGAIGPTPDVCDGVDNDCNGTIDPTCACSPEAEQCRDGIDNDCDGRIDEPACRPDWRGPCVDGDAPTAFEQLLIDLPPQTWFEAPDSHMREVCSTSAVVSMVNCYHVVNAWGGGAYDSVHRRMLVWGGGPSYWGNEIYAFDLRTGSWFRQTEPSEPAEGASITEFYNRDPLPDGQPVSRHSYDGVEFMTDLGVLWVHGGSRATDGSAIATTWSFDPVVGWSQRATGPGGYSLASAYDPRTRRIFVHATENFHIYDVETDTWTTVPGFGSAPLWPRYAGGGDRTGVIDTRRGLYWTVGGFCFPDDCQGNVFVWDIGAGTAVTDDWNTTGGGAYSNRDLVGDMRPDQLFEGGGGAIYNVPAPGIDYDTAADDLVAWPNAGAPYALDLETREWTLGNEVGAPTSTRRGTFGRWRYIEAYNVFILVTSVDDNVHFYKHTAGCGR